MPNVSGGPVEETLSQEEIDRVEKVKAELRAAAERKAAMGGTIRSKGYARPDAAPEPKSAAAGSRLAIASYRGVTRGPAPTKPKMGRPKVHDEDVIERLARDNPGLSHERLAELYIAKTGLKIGDATISRVLHSRGIAPARVCSPRPDAEPAGVPASQTPAHVATPNSDLPSVAEVLPLPDEPKAASLGSCPACDTPYGVKRRCYNPSCEQGKPGGRKAAKVPAVREVATPRPAPARESADGRPYSALRARIAGNEPRPAAPRAAAKPLAKLEPPPRPVASRVPEPDTETRSTPLAELDAMQVIAVTLEELEPESAERVLAWIGWHYGTGGGERS